MKEEIKNNKKILIISLVAILLVSLGVTLAYFIRSAIANTTEVTTEVLTLDYQENKDYMMNGLIPSSKENALKGALNQDNNSNGICKDSNNNIVCNLYEFSVRNTSSVTQDVDFYLYQQINGYSNLKYMIYNTSIDNHNYTSSTLKKDATSITIDDNEDYPGMKLDNISLTLGSNEDITYTILFYLEETGENQVEDMNKKFVADVHAISYRAGKYNKEESEGYHFESTSLCWTIDQIEGTNNYRLVSFPGLNENTGEILEGCEGSVSGNTTDGYTVNIPSKVDGKNITNIGNTLLYSLNISDMSFNKYQYIREINISEEIKTIDDGYGILGFEDGLGAFGFINYDPFEEKLIFEEGLKIDFPSSLEYIGCSTFYTSGIMNLDLSGLTSLTTIGDSAFAENNISTLDLSGLTNLTTIGDRAFQNNNISTLNLSGLTNLTTIERYAFSGNNISTLDLSGLTNLTTIGDGAFVDNDMKALDLSGCTSLTTIGEYAFCENDLNYQNENNPLIIPSNVEYIGGYAFYSNPEWLDKTTNNYSNPNLKYIKYTGSHLSDFDPDWAHGVPNIITSN